MVEEELDREWGDDITVYHNLRKQTTTSFRNQINVHFL
jgi:hypothetical protein